MFFFSEKIVHVDKRITLGKLKESLKSDVGCSPEFFRVCSILKKCKPLIMIIIITHQFVLR